MYWKKDGRRIDSNDGILILRSGQRLSILNIESVQSRHAGNYTCAVKSQAGIIEHSAELHVNGTYISIDFNILGFLYLIFNPH